MPCTSIFAAPCPDFFQAFGGVPVFAFEVMRNTQFDDGDLPELNIAGEMDAYMMLLELRNLMENGDRRPFPLMPQDDSLVIVVVDWCEIGKTSDFYWAVDHFMPISKALKNIQFVHVLPKILEGIPLEKWNKWGTGFPEDISHLCGTPLWPHASQACHRLTEWNDWHVWSGRLQ